MIACESDCSKLQFRHVQSWGLVTSDLDTWLKHSGESLLCFERGPKNINTTLMRMVEGCSVFPLYRWKDLRRAK